MTLQEISDKSDVPTATVKRIMSGQTPEPSFSTVISMIKAMDGSVSDVEEALVVNDNSENTNNSNIGEERIVRLSDNDRLIRVYELSLMAKNRWIRNLTILCVAMIAIFVFCLSGSYAILISVLYAHKKQLAKILKIAFSDLPYSLENIINRRIKKWNKTN